MTKPPVPENTSPLEEQAVLIAGEIFNLINQYTHDSNVSKFFLNDEVARACYSLAGGFSSVIYSPPLSPEDIKDTPILSFFYTLMTYGFNIYLREHSLNTNSAPYTMPTDHLTIKKMQKKTLSLTSRGKLVSTPLADKIIDIIIENVKSQMSLNEFVIKKHRFGRKKFLDYSRLSSYWGYNFARELLQKKRSDVHS